MNTVLNRLYSDYLMPSQLAAYETLLRAAQEANYRQISVRMYQEMVETDEIFRERTIIHRHDIDTDLRTTRKIFEIEKNIISHPASISGYPPLIST